MTETPFDYKKIFKHKEVVDLSLLSGDISTEEGFTNAVLSIAPSQKLPKMFPNIPLIHNRLDTQSVTMNDGYKVDLLTLPQALYDSESYVERLELRGPMEEIIIAYEKERIMCGMPRNKIFGSGWSNRFEERFRNLNLKTGKKERKETHKTIKKEGSNLTLRGSKIA